MKALSESEVKEFLSSKLPEWSFGGEFIKRDFKFKNFIQAFSFMTAIALKAEKMDHHPDWSNVYNNVVINLKTHDAGGITSQDLDLAQFTDNLFSQYV